MPTDSGATVLEALRRHLIRLDPRLADVRIDPQANLFDERYLDSLGATELLAFIEEQYGVRLEADRLLSDLSSLQALATCVATEARPRS